MIIYFSIGVEKLLITSIWLTTLLITSIRLSLRTRWNHGLSYVIVFRFIHFFNLVLVIHRIWLNTILSSIVFLPYNTITIIIYIDITAIICNLHFLHIFLRFTRSKLWKLNIIADYCRWLLSWGWILYLV